MSPPAPDLESAPFWAGLRSGRVLLQECTTCQRRRLPRMPGCPYCAAPGAVDVEVPGTGTVYSWVRVHRDLGAGAVADLPYAVVTVDLDGGGRIFGRIEPAAAAAIGLPVEPFFVEHGERTELRFRPARSSGTGAG